VYANRWQATALLFGLPVVLGLLELGGGDDRTFWDGAALGLLCWFLVGIPDVVARLEVKTLSREALVIAGCAGLIALWHLIRAGDLDVGMAAGVGAAVGGVYVLIGRLFGGGRLSGSPDPPGPDAPAR
jgi:hypothetical protein